MSDDKIEYSDNFDDLVNSISYPNEIYLINQGFKKDYIRVILKNLVVGLTIQDCCDLVGISIVNLNSWHKENIGGIGTAITSATARNKQYHVSNIYNGKDPLKTKGSMFWLERKHKKEFSKEVILSIQGGVIEGMFKLLKDMLVEFVKDPEELVIRAELLGELVEEINENAVSGAMINMKGER